MKGFLQHANCAVKSRPFFLCFFETTKISKRAKRGNDEKQTFFLGLSE